MVEFFLEPFSINLVEGDDSPMTATEAVLRMEAMYEQFDVAIQDVARALAWEMACAGAVVQGFRCGALIYDENPTMDGDDIPDTPLDEWNAKVDELLKECEEQNPFFAL